MLAMNFKNAKYAMLAMLLIGGVAWAQPMSNEMAQGMYDAEVRKRRAQQQQGANTGPSAAEVRAWEQRERQIQARIAKHRATPYWMAIGRDWVNKGFVWSGGHASKQKAMEEALEKCKSNCEIIATFANACGVIVYVHGHPKSISDIFIGVDPDDKKAAVKAMQSCEAVHGKNNPDRCFYSGIQTKNGTAFCAGYDYSVYGQQ